MTSKWSKEEIAKIKEAFKMAKRSRREAGLPAPTLALRRLRGGPMVPGPRNYRVTIWLSAGQYHDVVKTWQAQPYGTLTAFMKESFLAGTAVTKVKGANQKLAS